MNSTEQLPPFVDILLVEDNKHDADLAMRALHQERLANNLIWLKDGQQCLDFLFGDGDYKGVPMPHGPKLILLDLNLPKVNGLEVLEVIRKDVRSRHIPVVMMTSSREDQDLVRSYDLGVNSYVLKPLDFTEFTDVVKHLGFYWLLVNKSIQDHE